ncbi:hypothetical protein H1R20_g15964, partial [Candolleomyces eurysporus]
MLGPWSSSRRVSNSRKASREASRDASYPGKQHGSHSNKLGCANVGGEETFKLERAERVPHYGVPETQRDRYKRVAEKALQTIEKGSYMYRGKFTPLHIKNTTDRTKFFPEESVLTEWRKKPVVNTQRSTVTEVSLSILNVTTLDAARILSNSYRFQGYEGAPPQTGVLNFASATKPGGGFINGAEAQEESIARVSTLYASLTTSEGNRFYEAHTRRLGAGRDKAYEAYSRPRTGQDQSSYYTHGMVYSPGVVVFQNDEGDAVDQYQIEVVSCAAVNAGRAAIGWGQHDDRLGSKSGGGNRGDHGRTHGQNPVSLREEGHPKHRLGHVWDGGVQEQGGRHCPAVGSTASGTGREVQILF